MKEEIQNKLVAILQELGIDGVPIQIDIPADKKNGDYSSNLALIAGKMLHKNPRELAEEIAQNFQVENSDMRLEVAGPGFINFFVSNEKLLQSLATVTEIPQLEKGNKVVVEYSSPNIAKPFTVGHLRSTIIGDAVANLLQATGWRVYRDNHLGDWGTQFGKQIYALIHLGEGSLEKNLEMIQKSERPVKDLVNLYVEFHDKSEHDPSMEDEAREWFTKLEKGDPKARELWQKCIDWSWKEFEGIYKQLNVTFTENDGRGYGESFFEDKMDSVLNELEEKGLLKEGEEGAKLVFFEGDKYPPLMILKKDGSTLYATRDLATDKFRKEMYGDDVLVINEIGVEQSLYMQQIFAIEQLLGWYQEGKRVHIKHGHFRFKEGKMSTRKGNVVWLEDVLEEARQRAHGLQKHSTEFEGDHATTTNEKSGKSAKQHVLGVADRLNLADSVAIGAIKWNDLKRDSKQDIVFDWDDILNMQGNSGPYMQYTFARTQSVLLKADGLGLQTKDTVRLEPEDRDLLLKLSQFSETVKEAAKRFAPNVLCTYLFELAQAFNLFYQKHPILKAEKDERNLRLAITKATGEVIQQGLDLLGIESPQRM